jgi:diphthamide biosynthesis methyltransferase
MHSDNTSLEKLVELYLDLRAEAKKKYIQADEILDQILETHEFKGQNIILPDGRLAVLQDNYSDRNKVFRSHGMNRFDIEEVKVKKSRKKA